MNSTVEHVNDDFRMSPDDEDDDGLREMMDISFPLTIDDEAMGEDDDEEENHSNIEKKGWKRQDIESYDQTKNLDGVVFDIKASGWDDKAISTCFDLSMAFHEYDGDIHDLDQFVFQPGAATTGIKQSKEEHGSKKLTLNETINMDSKPHNKESKIANMNQSRSDLV